METKQNNKDYMDSISNGIELFYDIFSMFKNRFSLLIFLNLINSILEGLGLTLIVSMLQYSSINELNQSESKVLNFLFDIYYYLGIDSLFKSIIFLIFILFMSAVIYLIQSRIGCLIQTEYSYKWKERLINKIFLSNWYKISRYKSGLLINAVTTETAKISAAVFEIKLLVSTFIYIFFYAIFAISITWKLTLVIIFSGVLIYISSKKAIGKNHSDASNLLDQNKELQTGLIEYIACHKYIKATGSENFALDNLTLNIQKLKLYDYRTAFRPQLNRVIVEFLGILFILFSIITSFIYFKIELAEMSLVIIAFIRIMPRVVSIQHSFFILINTKPSFDQLRKIDKSLVVEQSKYINKSNKSNVIIKFKDYSLKIDKRKILDNINLDISHRSFVGITGQSGSGKSTLLNCIAGLYGKSNKIEIYLSNHKKNETPNNNIGYVCQDHFLINSTIRDNISWGKKFSNAEIMDSIHLAGLDKVIKKLKKGIDTNLGEAGAFFSGGEKQRISLARELVKKPQILLLDEPTSALDKKTENSIMETIHGLKGKITILMTSHRYNALQFTDNIISMDNGKIITRNTWVPHNINNIN